MSIPFLYMCGRRYNQLANCAAEPVPASAHAVLGRVAALWDYSTEEPFYFDGSVGGNRIDADLNQVVNGGFETAFSGGLPGTGWGKSSGATLTRETTGTLDEGAAVMKVVGTDEYGYFDRPSSPGEVVNFSAAAQTTLSGGLGDARVMIQNLNTGKWLTGHAEWQSAPAAWIVITTTASFSYAVGQLTVEDYSACQADVVTLRFYYQNTGPATAARFDRCYAWPRVNRSVVIGHNVPSGMVLALRSGPTSAVLNGRGQFTIAQPTMHLGVGNVDDRYWRLVGGDAPDLREVFMREWILGQASELLRQRDNGAEIVLIDPQDRSASPLGPGQAYPRTERARRRLSMPLQHPDEGELSEAQWIEIMERSRNGAYPLLMVPDSTKANSAMLCMSSPEWARSHVVRHLSSSRAELDELPFYATTA